MYKSGGVSVVADNSVGVGRLGGSHQTAFKGTSNALLRMTFSGVPCDPSAKLSALPSLHPCVPSARTLVYLYAFYTCMLKLYYIFHNHKPSAFQMHMSGLI